MICLNKTILITTLNVKWTNYTNSKEGLKKTGGLDEKMEKTYYVNIAGETMHLLVSDKANFRTKRDISP